MSDIRTGIPKVSGQDGVPEPFNLNDVLVWKALICKFICNKLKDRFSKSALLEALISGEVGPSGAYDKNEMQKAVNDKYHAYSRLIKFCLEDMTMKDLFQKDQYDHTNDSDCNSYHITVKFKGLCPEILKYDMAGIDDLVQSNNDSLQAATTEIYQDEAQDKIANLLDRLASVNQLSVAEALRYVDKGTLERLIENGSVKLYLDNKIAISFIGRQILSKRLQ
jgi:hypothetical protein